MAVHRTLVPPLHGSAKFKATKLVIANVTVALDEFKAQLGRYPTTKEGLQALLTPPRGSDGWDHPFLERLPQDGWHHEFRYRFSAAADIQTFDLVSAGDDGDFDTRDDVRLDSQRP